MPAIWPELEYREWRETALALQLWLQVAGKVRLALTPWLNHSWQVPLLCDRARSCDLADSV